MPTLHWREAHVIIALRMACGWQVKELAERANLNASVIYRIEDGRVQHPTLGTLQKLAAAFGITVREIRNAVPQDPMQFAGALPVKLPAKTTRETRAAPSARAPIPRKKTG